MMTPSLVPKPWGQKPLCSGEFCPWSPALPVLFSQELWPPLCPLLMGRMLKGDIECPPFSCDNYWGKVSQPSFFIWVVSHRC